MAGKEWFRIVVIGQQTDHRFAGDIVIQIQALLRKYGIPKHMVEFEAWGDERPAATSRRIAPAGKIR